MFFNKKSNPIEYFLKRSKKTKTLKLFIRANGEVCVSAPYRISKKYIDSFVQSKQNWIEEKLNYIESLPQPHIKTKPGDYKKYKQKALELVKEKIEKFNLYYNFEFNKIAIRDQKTRWGSCSNKKNLNFSYKLALIPEKLAEYVIVHELCHLQEMNHGPQFWKLVENTIPDYKKIRKQLRELRI